MATAYTSLLGLALPVQGELDGTWGDTVNDEITSLLDSAVAGTTTLSSDADVTLSTTDGASNQARQAILLCTGSRTAPRTITAPAQSKAYIVINSTSGGFDVNIVGAGPTTGVTIANGTKALVAWNGADFVVVASTDYLSTSGGTVSGDVSVTGNLTVAEYTETVYALTGTAIDPANGTIQTKTLSGNTTFTDSLTAGQSVVLMLDAGASYTVTWPTITWVSSAGNAAPTLTANDTLVFWKISTTLYGAYVGSYTTA